MNRLLGLTDFIGAGVIGLLVYKAVEVGPYEASLLMGRCLRILISSMQGYI